jgi:hypothetical protein
MLKKLILSSITLFFAADLQAANILTSNFNGDANTVAPVITSSGTKIASGSGIVLVGYFDGVTDAQISSLSADTKSTVIGAFVSFGTTVRFGGSDINNAAGIYFVDQTGSIPATTTGNNIYTIIGNSTDLNASNEFLVYKHTQTFPLDGPTAAASAILGSSGGTLLLGSATTTSIPVSGLDGITGGNGYQLAQLAPIPEPTVAGLGVLALALVRRRRR